MVKVYLPVNPREISGLPDGWDFVDDPWYDDEDDYGGYDYV